MKAYKTTFLLAFAFALGAFADAVSPATARLAAGSWALSNASLGVPHGRKVSAVEPYEVAGTNGFYAVSLEGGGTVFLSADDTIGPILGFTASSNPDLSGESPLLNLLQRDVAARRRAAGASQSGSRVSYAANASGAAAVPSSQESGESARARKLWSVLVPTPKVRENSGSRVLFGATADPVENISAISDIRVEPILTSQWSQEDANGQPCYNYYTPYNFPCGCVATAAGQILYRWKWPQGELNTFSNSCTVANAPQTLQCAEDPRIYNWDDMVPVPENGIDLAGRKAIGALLFDLGLAFGADYGYAGTGAYEHNVPGPLRRLFNYASAYTYTVNGTGEYASSLHYAPTRQKAILANLDAKRPVELYILSNAAGGHAVVADGYGYVEIAGESIEFTHVNMGWAGVDDMWYNLPVIQTKEAGAQAGQSGGYTFEYLMGATFNIHPTETGNLLTGRILDDGDPVQDATVVAVDPSTGAELAQTLSDKYGIYSFCLPGDATYSIRVTSSDGKKSGVLDDVYLPATTVSDTSTYTTQDESDIGNSWGNDIDIVIPFVRIGSKLYPNLNNALKDAQEGDTVEIFGPTKLKSPVTIVSGVSIITVPDETSDYPLLSDCTVSVSAEAMTTAGWALQIADGVDVAFSNILFAASSGSVPAIDVLDGGSVSFAGTVSAGTVTTRAADAFTLAGPIESVLSGIAVSCAGATARNNVFGSWSCSQADAEASAAKIANGFDADLFGRAMEDGTLVWDRAPVDESIAVAKATDEMGTVFYTSLDSLFRDFTNGAEVVVFKDCGYTAFSNAVSVAKNITITGSGDVAPVISGGNSAGFTITDGAAVSVSNVVFTRSGSSTASTASLFTIDGGSLALESGAAIAGLKFAGSASAILVNNGSVSMSEGSSITNCTGTSSGTQEAVAIVLKGENCSLAMTGGEISGCSGGKTSGGVYAGAGSAVSLEGKVFIKDNVNKNKATRNLYLAKNDILTATGDISGTVGVYSANNLVADKQFGSAASEEAGVAAADSFTNDYRDTLEAVADGTALRWKTVDPSDGVARTEGEAAATLIDAEGGETHYVSLEYAFANATNGNYTIVLKSDLDLTNSVGVASGNSVLLDGAGFTLWRGEDCNTFIAVTNATLSLTNITVDAHEGYGRIIDAKDSALALLDGASVEWAEGYDKTMVAAIVVWGGTFTMEDGSGVRHCANYFARDGGGPIAAGGVVVYGSSSGASATAYLNGGEITDCVGPDLGAGGMYVGNGAHVYVKGVAVTGNKSHSGAASNLVVQDKSSLVLAGRQAAKIGFTEGYKADTNVFGTVAKEFVPEGEAVAGNAAWSNLVVYARQFVHDSRDVRGAVATNAADTVLLVWEDAFDENGAFAASDGTVYGHVDIAVDDMPGEKTVIPCEEFTFTAIEKTGDGKWRLVLAPGVEGCTYTLFATDDLSKPLGEWTQIGEPKTLAADDLNADSEFEFEAEPSDPAYFWYVKGEDGEE